MPSDPLEAELLAMAGAAIGVDDNLLGMYLWILNRGVNRFLKLGGQVVMRRLLFCPSLTPLLNYCSKVKKILKDSLDSIP